MKILVSGATGLIGKKLVKKLNNENINVTILTRSKNKAEAEFDDNINIIETDYKHLTEQLTDSFPYNAIINLAGENIAGKRWSNSFKKRLYDSRIDVTDFMVNIANNENSGIETFVSGSATGYYDYSNKLKFDENSAKGKGFLPDLVESWENRLNSINDNNIKKVFIRTGVALANKGGALQKMVTPFKLFVGGPIGNGKQPISWIHIDDLVNIFYQSVTNSNYSGIINGVAPNPVNMNTFSKTIGTVLKRPSIFRVPEFIINIIMGEGAQIVTKGSYVYSNKLEQLNFEFKYKDIKSALDHLL